MNNLNKAANVVRLRWIISKFLSTKSKEDIEKLITNDKVVVFMKGIPQQPQCGFSNAVVQILRMHGVKYESHNVLNDENLRQGKSFIII